MSERRAYPIATVPAGREVKSYDISNYGMYGDLANELQKAVNKELADGWEFHGIIHETGPSAITGTTWQTLMFTRPRPVEAA